MWFLTVSYGDQNMAVLGAGPLATNYQLWKRKSQGAEGPFFGDSSPVPFCLLDRMAAPWAQGSVGALLLSSSYVLSGVLHLPDVHPHALRVWSPK